MKECYITYHNITWHNILPHYRCTHGRGTLYDISYEDFTVTTCNKDFLESNVNLQFTSKISDAISVSNTSALCDEWVTHCIDTYSIASGHNVLFWAYITCSPEGRVTWLVITLHVLYFEHRFMLAVTGPSLRFSSDGPNFFKYAAGKTSQMT